MLRLLSVCSAVFVSLGWLQVVAAQQDDRRAQVESTIWTSLPADRSLRVESGLPLPPVAPPVSELGESDDRLPRQIPQDDNQPFDFKSLLKPRFDLSAEWQPRSEDVGIHSYDLSIQMPLYPVFGPPPPFITSGYSFTNIDAPTGLDLPQSLHEFSLGLAWMRPIKDRWLARLTLTGVFASDLNNTSSDAWRIRGGGFAVYRPNERWSFAFGALATGRDDLPVLPAVGAIWEPSPELRVNLMLPTPRVARLIVDSSTRQHWVYAGAGISGGTWAYERVGGIDQRLSYREWRLVLGWESMPPRSPGRFLSSGTKWNAEIGYVLGREFEFERNASDISLENSLLLRTRLTF